MQIDPGQAQLNDVMKMMDQTWAESKMAAHQQHEAMMANAMLMEQAFIDSKMAEADAMRNMAMMKEHWQAAHELQMAHDWRADFIQNEVLESKAQMLEGAFTDAQNKVKAQTQEDLENTNNLMALMENDPDPRFQNSKFLDFLHKVKTGEYELDTTANELKVHPEKHIERENKFNLMNEAFKHAAAQEEEISESKLALCRNKRDGGSIQRGYSGQYID